MLSVQLFHLWALLDRPRPFIVVEPGGGDGLLCRDILTASSHLPDGFGDAIRYTIIDPCPAAGHEEPLPNALRATADIFAADPSSLPLPAHCVLSNELLDALPVHGVRMEGGRLLERCVGIESDVADGYEGAFVELAGEPSTPALASRLAGLGITLADGQSAEICLLLDAWSELIASWIDRGFVLTIDYGRAAGDLYDPALRPDGALVTYRNHRQTDAPLRDVGRQDITAQVDFTSVQQSGEAAGLTTLGNVPQGWLLHRLGLQTIRRVAPPLDAGGSGWITLPAGPDGLPPEALPESAVAQPDPSTEGLAWRANLTHLAQPGGLGDFRILFQAKGLDPKHAAGALSWLDGEPAQHGRSPAALAGMIPPEALAFGPERIRLTQ